MTRVLISVLLLVSGFALAEDPPPRPVTVGEITSTFAPLIPPSAQVDIQQLDAALQGITKRIAAAQVLPSRSADAEASSAEKPLAPSGQWRLWVFWAMDAPECEGLASELVRVRASGLAAVRPVHLASYRAWEGWLFRMNDYREGLLAAASTKDRQQVDRMYQAWSREMSILRTMADAWYGGTVPLVCDTTQAVVLLVDQVPSFRLISPSGRVHSLAGFATGVDLVSWVSRCQTWEDQMNRGGR